MDLHTDMAAKSKAYIMHVDFDKLKKFANVFHRLNDDSKTKVLGMIEKDPFLAGHGVSAMTNIQAMFGITEESKA